MRRTLQVVMILVTVIAGILQSQPMPSYDWIKTFDYGDGSMGNYVSQTSDKGFIIVGETDLDTVEDGDTITNVDVYLIKTDSLGNMLWQKTFGGSEVDWGSSVQQNKDRGYIVAGATQSFGNGGFDVYLIKTDSLGNQLWQKTFGGSCTDEGHSVQQTSDGGYIITGMYYDSTDDRSKVYLIKLRPESN